MVVVHGGTVGVGNTLTQAIAQSFVNEGQQAPPTGGQQPPPPTGNLNQQIARLVAQAAQHFRRADAALKAGNLGTYQKEIQLAQQLIKRANDLAARSGSSPASPTPSATPTK